MRKQILLFGGMALLYVSAMAQTLTLTINPSTTYQTIRGLGGSGSMQSGYDTYLRYVVDLMGASGWRHYMDGNSLGKDRSVNDILNNNYDYSENTGYANFYKALKAKGVTFIVSTCWSPPASLKANQCICQSWGGQCCSSPCGTYNCSDPNNYLKDEYFDEYGKFLAAWIKDFQTRTTQTIYAFNIQNEPFFNEPYSSALLYDSRFGPCLQAVRTELNNAGLSSVKLFGPEDMGSYNLMNGTTPNRAYIKYLLWNATWRQYLDVFAVHSYLDGIQADLGSAAGWTKLDTAVRKYTKGGAPMELWMTETDFGGTADYNMAWDMASQIFCALKYGKVNAWLYWGMDGNDGMYVSGSPTARLYACMHFMRFIRPGYQQVECTETDPDITGLAFKNGNDYTVVVMNVSTSKTKTVTFNSFTGRPGYFDMYRSRAISSTQMEKCVYVGRVSNNSFDIPPKSIVTLYFKESEPNVYWGVSSPGNLTATNVTENSITVTWSAVSPWTLAGSQVNITGYVVYLNGVKKTSTPITSTTYTFTGLTKGTKYVIEVYTRDALYNESAPARIEVTTAGGTTPQDIDEETAGDFQVSPNPASYQAVVSLPGDQLYEVSVVNINGAKVSTVQLRNGDKLDVSGLPSGMYILVAKDKQKTLQTRIVVQ